MSDKAYKSIDYIFQQISRTHQLRHWSRWIVFIGYHYGIDTKTSELEYYITQGRHAIYCINTTRLHCYCCIQFLPYNTEQGGDETTPTHSRNNRQRPRISCLSSVRIDSFSTSASDAQPTLFLQTTDENVIHFFTTRYM